MPIAKFSRFLTREAHEHQANERSKQQLATAMLLFDFVRSDGKAKMMELLHMSELLRKEFSLTQLELEQLFHHAELARKENQDSNSVVLGLAQSLALKDRIKLMEFLWVLAYADDHLDDAEKHKIETVARQLKLSHIQRARAQENAELHLGL